MFIKLVEFRVVPQVLHSGVDVNCYSAEYMDDCDVTLQLSCDMYGYDYDNLGVRVSTTAARQKFVNAAIDAFKQLIKDTNCYIGLIAHDDEQQCEEG